MGEQRLRVLRQRSKRCCNRSNLPGANTVRVLMGHPPSTTEWTANDTNGFSRFHARLPKRHPRASHNCQGRRTSADERRTAKPKQEVGFDALPYTGSNSQQDHSSLSISFASLTIMTMQIT